MGKPSLLYGRAEASLFRGVNCTYICGGETDLQKSQLALAFVHQATLTAIDYTVVWKITSDAFCV